MAERYFGDLDRAEATALFEAWVELLPERSAWFVGLWRPGESVVPPPEEVESAMRFTASRCRFLMETPGGSDLPLWVAPGKTYEGINYPSEPDVESAWLLDGLMAWHAVSVLEAFPTARPVLYRNEKRGSQDTLHNEWCVEVGPSLDDPAVPELFHPYKIASYTRGSVCNPRRESVDFIGIYVRITLGRMSELRPVYGSG
jgi:hypothetical protein